MLFLFIGSVVVAPVGVRHNICKWGNASCLKVNMSNYEWPDVFEKDTLQYYQVTGTDTYQLDGAGTAYTKSQIYAAIDDTKYFPRFYVRGLKTSEIGDLG